MDQQQLSASQFGARAISYLSSTVHSQGPISAGSKRSARAAAGRAGARRRLWGGSRKLRARPWRSAAGGRVRTLRQTCLASSRKKRTRVDSPRSGDPLRRCRKRLRFSRRCRVSACRPLPASPRIPWASVPRALAPVRSRSLKSSGKLVVIDVVAPEPPLLDTSLQVLEFLRARARARDSSRCRVGASMRTLRWEFAEPSVSRWKLPMEFNSWIAAYRHAASASGGIGGCLRGTPPEARRYFQVGAGRSLLRRCGVDGDDQALKAESRSPLRRRAAEARSLDDPNASRQGRWTLAPIESARRPELRVLYSGCVIGIGSSRQRAGSPLHRSTREQLRDARAAKCEPRSPDL